MSMTPGSHNYRKMAIDIKANKEEFCSLLRSTRRDGIEYVIQDLEEDGFFEAPASAGHHLNVEGGLVQHSLNTYRVAHMLWEYLQPLEPSVKTSVKEESVILASLLHDVCKANIYKPTVKKRRNALGVVTDVPGYDVSYRHMPLGHGEKSVIQLLYSGLDLHEDEMLAIRWHMGAFGLNQFAWEDVRSFDAARTLSPLVAIIQAADSLSASILETTAEDIDHL